MDNQGELIKKYFEKNPIRFPKPPAQTLKYPEQLLLALMEGFYNVFEPRNSIFTSRNGKYVLKGNILPRLDSLLRLDLLNTKINYGQNQNQTTFCCTEIGLDFLFDLIAPFILCNTNIINEDIDIKIFKEVVLEWFSENFNIQLKNKVPKLLKFLLNPKKTNDKNFEPIKEGWFDDYLENLLCRWKERNLISYFASNKNLVPNVEVFFAHTTSSSQIIESKENQYSEFLSYWLITIIYHIFIANQEPEYFIFTMLLISIIYKPKSRREITEKIQQLIKTNTYYRLEFYSAGQSRRDIGKSEEDFTNDIPLMNELTAYIQFLGLYEGTVRQESGTYPFIGKRFEQINDGIFKDTSNLEDFIAEASKKFYNQDIQNVFIIDKEYKKQPEFQLNDKENIKFQRFKDIVLTYLKETKEQIGTFFGENSLNEYIQNLIEVSHKENLDILQEFSTEESFRKYFPILKDKGYIRWNYSGIREDHKRLKDLDEDEKNSNRRSPNIFYNVMRAD